MKDRDVQFPNRYRVTKVDGTDDIYDFEPVPGEVREDGSFVNKGLLFSDETATKYNLSGGDATPNKAFEKLATAAIVKNKKYSEFTPEILAFGGSEINKHFFQTAVKCDTGLFFVTYESYNFYASYTDDGGKTWKVSNVAIPDVGIRNEHPICAFGNSTIVIVWGRQDTAKIISVSHNYGKTWTTKRFATEVSAMFTGVAFGNGKFMAVTYTGEIVTSANGDTWEYKDTNISSTTQSDITNMIFADGKFVAVAGMYNGQCFFLYMEDFMGWKISAKNYSENLTKIVYTGKYFYTLSSIGRLYKSVDGKSWDAVREISDGDLSTLLNIGDTLITISSNGENFIYSLNEFAIKKYYPVLESVEGNIDSSFAYSDGEYVYVRSDRQIYTFSLREVVSFDTELENLAGESISPAITTGTYLGTGKYGKENKNSVISSFVPKAIIICRKNVASGSPEKAIIICNYSGVYSNGSTSESIYSTVEVKTVKWYSIEGAAEQMNMSGIEYAYTLLG